MKILITRDFLIEQSYKEAFESLDHEVLNYRPTETIEQIHKQVAGFAPDLVIVHSPWDVTYKQMAAVKTTAKDAIFVFATHEDPMEYYRFAEFVPLCDHHFSGDRDSFWKYEEDYGVKVEHLPVAANPFIHYPIPLESVGDVFTSDLAFVGNNYPDKERIASERKMIHPFFNNPKYDFKCWGGDIIIDDMFKQVSLGVLPYADLNKVYSGTKIGLGVARRTSHEGYLTMRYFEGPACGCFMLVDYCKGLEKMFVNRKHMIFVFDEYETVEQHVEYYLENEEERNKIAKQGRLHVLQNHTYINRAKKILEVAGF